MLSDLVVTPSETSALIHPARELGCEEWCIPTLHIQYFKTLTDAALRYGTIFNSVANALGVDPSPMQQRVADYRSFSVTSITSLTGLTICFTGDWDGTYDGKAWSRSLGESLSAGAGGKPVASVTKRTDLLVASDTVSMSGKAKKPVNMAPQ